MVKVIPAKWQEKTIGDIADFQGGSQPPLETFSNLKKEGYVRLIQIRDYKTDKYKTYIPQQLAKRFCSKDDIMIGRYGPPIFQILKGIDGAYNVALIKVIPKNIDKDFLYYTLSRKDLFEYIDQLSQRSSGQTGVDLEKLKEFDIVVPPLQEQRKIAIFLLDIDALISKFEQLVKKYQALKQACLQHMFPREGQTEPDVRLPGFADPWEQCKLGEIVNKAVDNRGKTPPISDEGTHPLIEVACLGNGFPDYSKIKKYLDDITFKSMLREYIKKDDILFSTVGSIGLVSLMDSHENAAIAQNIVAFRAKENYDSHFLYAMFSTKGNQNKAMRIVMGAVQPSIKVSQLINVEYYITHNIKEEELLGSFFLHIDHLITLHQRACEKYKKIKQGMMEELLSGKIRLV